jgi:hypothetical protein
MADSIGVQGEPLSFLPDPAALARDLLRLATQLNVFIVRAKK